MNWDHKTDWNWTYICPTGITPWLFETHQLATCFQQIFLQIPMLVVFAIISACHFGAVTNRRIQRNDVQTIMLNIRICSASILGLYPFFKYCYMKVFDLHVWPIDVLVGGCEMIAYIVHFGKCMLFLCVSTFEKY